MVLVGVILFVVSGALVTYGTVMVCHANPRTALPWLFRRPPPRTPWQASVLLGLAGGTGVLGAIQLSEALGYWAFLIIIGAWTPSVLIQYKHNRDAKTSMKSHLCP